VRSYASRVAQTSLRAKRSNPSLATRTRLDCFVASLLAMTTKTASSRSIFKQPNKFQIRLRDPAARCARVVHEPSAPKGVGNAGCPPHPQPRVQNETKHTSVVAAVTPDSPGIPARNGFNGYFVLSPVIGLVCHRHLRSCLRKLDAGVEASGPHDFAVRSTRLRQRLRRALSASPPKLWRRRKAPLVCSAAASTASRPHVRDDGQRPSDRDGTGRACRDDLPDGHSKIFLQTGLDRQFTDLPVGQISRLTSSGMHRLIPAVVGNDPSHRHGRASTRPSTSLIWLAFEGVDARDKPGHDESEIVAVSISSVWSFDAEAPE